MRSCCTPWRGFNVALLEEEGCCAEVRCIPSTVVIREDTRRKGFMSAAVRVAGEAEAGMYAGPDELKALWLRHLSCSERSDLTA